MSDDIRKYTNKLYSNLKKLRKEIIRINRLEEVERNQEIINLYNYFKTGIEEKKKDEEEKDKNEEYEYKTFIELLNKTQDTLDKEYNDYKVNIKNEEDYLY